MRSGVRETEPVSSLIITHLTGRCQAVTVYAVARLHGRVRKAILLRRQGICGPPTKFFSWPSTYPFADCYFLAERTNGLVRLLSVMYVLWLNDASQSKSCY